MSGDAQIFANRPIMQRLVRQVSQKKIPLSAMLVLTDRCHLRCQQCYLVANPRPELELEQIFSAIDQLVEAGTMFLSLSGGEPLLRTDIYDIIRYARNKGLYVMLLTTATPCNETRVAALVEAGLHRASISLYAAEAEIHDQVTQVPGSFEKTLAGIQRLSKAGISLQLKFLQMTTNVSQLLPTRKLAESLGAQFVVEFGITVCHDGRRDPLSLQLQEEALCQVYRTLAEVDPDGLGAMIKPRHRNPDAHPCGTGFSKVVISTDGAVYPCLDFREPIGSLHEQPFAAIWEGEANQHIRAIKSFSDPICRVCPDRSFCARCPSRADADRGDPSGPGTIMCLQARAKRRVYEERLSGEVPAAATSAAIGQPKTEATSNACEACGSGTLQRKIQRLLTVSPKGTS